MYVEPYARGVQRVSILVTRACARVCQVSWDPPPMAEPETVSNAVGAQPGSKMAELRQRRAEQQRVI